MSAVIAIDFGTSRTKLAYLDEATGRPELMRLGHRDDPFIPSLFYLERDSERVLLGDDAEAMLEQDSAGVVDVLKRKLHEAHVRANRRKVTPLDLMTRLLTELRTRAGREVAAFGGQCASTVHLTVPAIYGPSQAHLLREAAGQAGFTDVVLVPEPVAAARAWLAQARAKATGVVVFDCGGGTIDWAYLRREGEDFRLVPECPPGGDQVGGYDLDRELLEGVKDCLDDAALDELRGHETALLQAVRVIKERYCRDLPLQPVRFGGSEVRLSPSDIESAFKARFIGHASEGLKGYLAQVRAVSGPNQPPVLLVGGSARIKGLREAIKQDCGCEAIWWERADYATVLGGVFRVTSGFGESPKKHDHADLRQNVILPNKPLRPNESSDSDLLQESPKRHVSGLVEPHTVYDDGIKREVANVIEIDRRRGTDALRSYLRTHAGKRIKAWQAAAETGLPGAQWLLGMCLSIGEGVDQDEVEAVTWFRKAATQGDIPAQLSLGKMYLEGQGVTKDDALAVTWIRKAAEQGCASAQFNLGAMYRTGRGVVLDYDLGIAWYRKAAEQGHIIAQQNINLICAPEESESQTSTQTVERSLLNECHQDHDDEKMTGQTQQKKKVTSSVRSLESKQQPRYTLEDVQNALAQNLISTSDAQ